MVGGGGVGMGDRRGALAANLTSAETSALLIVASLWAVQYENEDVYQFVPPPDDVVAEFRGGGVCSHARPIATPE